MSSAASVPDHIARTVVSPLAYAEWDGVHRDLAWLRANLPLGKAAPDGWDPFWIVSRHADIMEVGRNPLVFKNNSYRNAPFSRKAERDLLAAMQTTPFVRALVTMDGPEHLAFRKLTFANFAPKGLQGLRDTIGALADRTMAELPPSGTVCDFVDDVALRYPLRVIMSILGLPDGDEALMLQMTQQFFNPQDPELNASGAEVADHEALPVASDLMANFISYFNALTDSRRAHPTDDIASKIANGRINGALLSHWDAMSYYVAIATAGHDTTSSSVAGGMWALAERPELFARVKADRSLIPALVDESIRWTSPLICFMRTAAQDYSLRGQTIGAGDWLLLSYPSANNDEEVYDRPYEFRLDRPVNPHLAFGYGPHVCIGQHLARLEMRIFFEKMFDRVKSVELAGTPQRTKSAFVGGIKHLPVRMQLN